MAIDTGSTSTKVGYFSDGIMLFEDKLIHTADELTKFSSIPEQEILRRDAVNDFLKRKGINLEDIDIVMARGGLISPVTSGVYGVNQDMKDVLISCKYGVHACNLSALIADDIVEEVKEARAMKNVSSHFGECKAYIADAPLTDEMLPECKVGGLPEFPRKPRFHALNSKAIVREYLRKHGLVENNKTIIVAHMGGGITTSLHKNGKVIDTNDGLGGDGPFSPERAGTCPAFPLVEMCFSGKYTEAEIKKKIIGRGGAVAYFGTSDLKELMDRASAGDERCAVFMKAFSLNISKYIASMAATAEGKVDAVLLTGGIANDKEICDEIIKRVSFIAPVEVYPGEQELDSLAENGYYVLDGTAVIHHYDKDRIVPDEVL